MEISLTNNDKAYDTPHGSKIIESTCDYVFRDGKLYVLYEIPAMLINNDYPLTSDCATKVTDEGNSDILKLLHEHGCILNEQVCEYAAEIGSLDMLKHAHESCCPWDERVCYLAARGHNLDILKYAREHDCPWDKNKCLDVAKNDEIRNWIKSH